jgi:hypothetical protein
VRPDSLYCAQHRPAALDETTTSTGCTVCGVTLEPDPRQDVTRDDADDADGM